MRLVAKQAERLGFAAVYLSGGALSAGWAGLPDVGLLTQTEFAEQAAVLARATSLPVLCDADTGFGEALNVERTVRLYEEAGVAGLHLEDQVLPKRCGHLSGKIADRFREHGGQDPSGRRAAAATRDFVIVARTDAVSVEGFDAAVRRAREYLAAGADMIFPEGPRIGRAIRPLRPGSEGTAAGQHDRVRPQPADPVRRAGGDGIHGRDLSAFGASRGDEGGERRARDACARRHAARAARPDATREPSCMT